MIERPGEMQLCAVGYNLGADIGPSGREDPQGAVRCQGVGVPGKSSAWRCRVDAAERAGVAGCAEQGEAVVGVQRIDAQVQLERAAAGQLAADHYLIIANRSAGLADLALDGALVDQIAVHVDVAVGLQGLGGAKGEGMIGLRGHIQRATVAHLNRRAVGQARIAQCDSGGYVQSSCASVAAVSQQLLRNRSARV